MELLAVDDRPARIATIAVRACTVTLDLRAACKRREQVTLQGVLASEIGRAGKDKLSWMLLTTHPVRTLEEARAVIHGYTQRWRVEEFHRAWKRGICNVESTQLHSREAIIKWATLLGAVAARAIRLAYLGRTSPETPARLQFTADEITAAFILSKRKRDRRRIAWRDDR